MAASKSKSRYIILYRLDKSKVWMVHPQPFEDREKAEGYARLIKAWREYAVAFADLADGQLRGRDFG